MNEWVAVASGGNCKLFRKHKGELSWLHTLENPMHRPHEREFHTDRPGLGRSDYAFGTAAHSYTAHKSALDQVKDAFARTLAQHLIRAWHENRFTRLTIIAEPHFFGLLRGHMGSLYDKMNPTHIAKDLHAANTEQLQSVL